jgi:hypothetical protein
MSLSLCVFCRLLQQLLDSALSGFPSLVFVSLPRDFFPQPGRRNFSQVEKEILPGFACCVVAGAVPHAVADR